MQSCKHRPGHGPGATEPSEAESGCDAFFAVSKAFTLLGSYMSNVQNPYKTFHYTDWFIRILMLVAGLL